MSAPSKVHNTRSVRIQPEERLEQHPATQVKGLAEVQFDAGDTFPTPGGGQGVPIKMLSITRRGCISEEPIEPERLDKGKPQVRFCEGAHGYSRGVTPAGGGL